MLCVALNILVSTLSAWIGVGNPFDMHTKVDLGSRKFYLIQMPDTLFHARVISADNRITLIMDVDGLTMVIQSSDIINIREKAYNSKFMVGAGMGLPYGIFGFNADYNVYKEIYLSGGIGSGIYVNPMLNIGCRYYLRSGNYKFRPRVSAYAGHTGIIYVDDQWYLGKVRESVKGVFFGFGYQWLSGIKKSWGMDLDLVFIAVSNLDKRADELRKQGYNFDDPSGSSVKISLGIRYGF